MKMYEFGLKFNWSLFLRFHLKNIPSFVQIMALCHVYIIDGYMRHSASMRNWNICKLGIILIQPLCMMTSLNGTIFRVTGPLCGEFNGHRWISLTWSFEVSFDLRLNKRLDKQSWGWWFETPSGSLWRYCNGVKPNKLVNFKDTFEIWP